MNRFALLPVSTIAVLLILVGIPILFVVLQAIFPHLGTGSFSEPLTAFADVLAQASLFALLKNTLWLGLSVALCCALIAIPTGALRGLYALPLARFWDLLFLVPFLIPPYIAGLSWMLALQPRGYAEQLLSLQPGDMLFSLPGIAGVMTLNIFPVVYFAVSRSMAASGSHLASVARVHGASSWQAFIRVTLPLALPATAASLLLAFTLAIEEYGIPEALGSHAGIQVLTTNIEQRLADWPIDLSGAAILSLLLVAIALCAYTLQRTLVSGRNVETTTGKPAAIVTRSLGIWRYPVLLLFSCVGLLAVGIPLASMLITAFSGTISGKIAWQNLTWHHFSMLLDPQNEALPALTTSVSLALGSALLTGCLGFLSSWLVTAKRIRGSVVIDMLSMLPAAVPGIVIGVGMILAWNQSFWPVTPYNSWGILLLAYSCLLLPYPVRYCNAALTQLGTNLESAARVHGASAMNALRLIILPLVFPSLLVAMMLVFAVASRELVTSLLLSPPGVQTVSIFVWRQFEQGSVGDGMAMACIAVFISLSVILLALRSAQKKTD